jgi:hypothetical protein
MITRAHALAGSAVTASVFIAAQFRVGRVGRSLSLPGDHRQTRSGSGVPERQRRREGRHHPPDWPNRPGCDARTPDPGRLPYAAARHTQEAACGRVQTACARNADGIRTFVFASLPAQQNIQI